MGSLFGTGLRQQIATAASASTAPVSTAKDARARLSVALRPASHRHAHHHAQRQRHPLRRAQGTRALARPHRAVGRRVPAGNQGARTSDVPQGAARAAQGARARSIPRRRKGYSGVAHLRAGAATASRTGFGSAEFDAEGRYLEADFGDVTVDQRVPAVGLERRRHRQASQVPLPRARSCRICGRCATRAARSCCAATGTSRTSAIDLKNWRSNQKNSGFLPEERAWLTRVFDELGFVDVFRRSTRGPISTRGGRTAARRGPRTSAGASTTRSPRPASPRRAHAASIYTNRALFRSRAADHRLRLGCCDE